MKKFWLLAAACGLLSACAGNPPKWWNPSAAYSNESAAPAAGKTQPVEQPASSGQETLPPVQEENIATVIPDDSYEEMILTPVQDEDTEEPAQGEQASSNTMDITPSAPDTSTSLPLPSVLAE